MSQTTVETKQLTLRFAREWFGIPKTTVYRHVAKKYDKFGAGRPAVGAVLDEKHRMGLLIATLVWLWGFNIHNFNRSHWIPVNFILFS